ncbi:unnamed protein product [Dicrocoelium dendriticum]|nr:unnamed protein product [Dicrocoelium dendriticum]
MPTQASKVEYIDIYYPPYRSISWDTLATPIRSMQWDRFFLTCNPDVAAETSYHNINEYSDTIAPVLLKKRPNTTADPRASTLLNEKSANWSDAIKNPMNSSGP